MLWSSTDCEACTFPALDWSAQMHGPAGTEKPQRSNLQHSPLPLVRAEGTMQKSRHVSHLALARKPYLEGGVLCPVMLMSCSVLPLLQRYPTAVGPAEG